MHQLDHRLADDVRSPLRHVRTRLYFTSESHIHSAFNVLRWGHQYARAPGGQPCLSIFSEEARAMFDEWALGYLTQLLFRVLYRKGEDETRPSSYTVQILVSPGVSLSDVDSVYEGSVFAPEEDDDVDSLSEPQALHVHCVCIALYTQPLRTGPLLAAGVSHCLLLTTPLLTACYSLLTAHCSLLIRCTPSRC